MTTRARPLVTAMRVFVLAFGTAALWLGRDGMNPDGVAYLDASDVYLTGDFTSGSGYWSPLYPMLLAFARLVGGTQPARELAIAQVVNFVAFLAAFAALEFFIRSMRLATAERQPGAPPNGTAWRVLAYALFTVVTVGWIRLWLLTPDMLVAAIVLAVSGLSIRMATGGTDWGNVAMLGVLLGIGYLTKAALLPVGVAVIVTLAVVLRRRRSPGWPAKMAVATGLFLFIATPQAIYVSRTSGRPTFSDVGRLSYLWFIAGVPGPISSAFSLPDSLPPPDGTPDTLAALDPSRDGGPEVYDIVAPLPGTLPIWYDAGYWYRDVIAPSSPRHIARALVRNARVYLEVFGFLIVGGLAAMAAGRPSRREASAMHPAWVLVAPALAACAMYALILVQTRYVAPFALPLFAGLVPPWAVDDLTRRLRRGFAVGAVAVLPLVLHQVKVDTAAWRGSASVRESFVAALAARGIGPGTRLAFIGEAYDAHWARLGRLRFVTLLPRAEAPRFWHQDEVGRAKVLDGMTRAGAQAIIAESPVPGMSFAGWQRLPPAGAPSPELLLYGASAGVAQR
ncbi:MAG TPA: hypothetical protein VFZ21_26870 [Gemmatimonadaceae bacterium]|nr:hypothetical protein [Gemmatimonadaceae bacterium]